MKNFYLLLLLCSITSASFSQVGIGTTTPSDASMLEISGTADGTTYKGLIPPRLPSQAEKANISPSTLDIGLMIFVEDTGTLEMWNGTAWEVTYTLSTTIVTAATQDFDSNTSWGFTENPVFYQVGFDIWDIVNSIGGATANANIDNVTDFYLGCRDLDNNNGGTPAAHVLVFDTINVSSLTNVKIAFDYDIFSFDTPDSVTYDVIIDGVATNVLLLGGGVGGATAEGTEVINIPNGATTVSINLGVVQNGNDDYAGFDNFRVYGE